MIRALGAMDNDLAAGFGIAIETEPLLLDIQTGSLRTKLGTLIKDIPDEILAKGEIRPIIGHFLVRAKHHVLRTLEPQTDFKILLPKVQLAIAHEAQAAGLEGLGYTPLSAPALADHMRAAARATQTLSPGDAMRYEAGGDATFLAPSSTLDDDALDEAVIAEELTSTSRMLLKVKRPDFLGEAQWDFRHGSNLIKARIVDEEWLSRFHARRVIVQPGDSLDAEVRVVARYAASGDLVRATHTIVRVLRVVSTDQSNSLSLPF
ncbi:hypothetical protein [Plastoroseomonas hellenica]|uniref:hypothetical protein n=1 Tax=Plastoroseomonas hellenica TaxID=2687306 RepID=UPI001BA8CB81|nr:hypothetical protein [Plastoroseomonas hellenica]MBR0643320.1 hypothetical protein [Plastoroseomonas hellenica]